VYGDQAKGWFVFMSKRMTDTGKWEKRWFRELPAAYKLFWQYILDKCNLAGIWDVDMAAAGFFIGEDINIERAKELFNGQITELRGEYWLINDFIKFQNGWPLNEKSPVHKKIITLLLERGIEIKNNTLYDRVYDRVLHTPIVIVKVIEEDNKDTKANFEKLQDRLMNMSESEKMRTLLAITDYYPKAGIAFVNAMLGRFLKYLLAKDDVYKPPQDYRNYFVNWLKAEIKKNKETIDKVYQDAVKYERDKA
jgi:hypothetical protein